MKLKSKIDENFPWYALCSNFLDLVISSLENMIEKGQSYIHEMSFKEWKKTLKEMLDGFKIAKKIDNSEVYMDEISKKDRDSINKSFDLFKKHFWNL
jgi:hypothetical protein